MLTRITRWFINTAPIVAGVVLLIVGTAGGISVAFGISLIGIGLIVCMWNWFIRMSISDDSRERETEERELRAREQHLPRQRPQPEQLRAAPAPRHPARQSARRRRRPS